MIARRLHALAVACAALAACTTAPAPATAADVLAANTAARGGAAKLAALQSVHIELEITEPRFTVTGDYYAGRNGWVRIDISDKGQRVFTEALGPDGGWQMLQDGVPKDMSADGEASLKRGIVGNLYSLGELAGLGYAVEISGETEDGVELRTTSPDGFVEYHVLDAGTWLEIASSEVSALHPDLDATKQPQETFISDWQTVDGIIFANVREKRDTATGKILQTTRVTSRELNPALDPTHFARPAAPDAPPTE